VKLLSDYRNVCDHNPPTLQADRRTTYDSNTALYARTTQARVSRGKKY